MEYNVCDVLIVGAGPVGLTAAGDLARAGWRVVVLERRPSVNPSSRAFAVMPRTLEALDARGIAGEVLATANRAPGVTLFAGAHLDIAALATDYPFVAITPQTNVDTALQNYALASGAELHRGWDVTGIEQGDAAVTVTAVPHDDTREDGEIVWRATYVIAADGAHSSVRRLLGVPFPGRPVLSSMVLADVKLADGPTDGGLTVGTTRDVLGFLAPYNRDDQDGSWFRAMVWDRAHQVGDDIPVDRAEVIDVLARAMGRDMGVRDIGWMSRFHCDERQVEQYRHGRVFFAGDAAHVHSPMGGQGMNTGIQDAVNLSWKLAAVLAGADDAMLDTYHDERHPIGRRVLRQSGAIARAVTLYPRPARALRDFLAPRLLRIPWVANVIAGSFAGTGLRYGHRCGEPRLVGTRAAGIPLAGTTIAELARTAAFVLIRERGSAPVTGSAITQAERRDAGPAVLIRPDGYIAWVGRGSDTDGWGAVLRRWTTKARVPA